MLNWGTKDRLRSQLASHPPHPLIRSPIRFGEGMRDAWSDLPLLHVTDARVCLRAGGHYTKTAMSSWWGVDSLPPPLYFITTSTMEAKEASGRGFVLSPFSQRFFMVVLSGLFSFRKGPCCNLQGADLED